VPTFAIYYNAVKQTFYIPGTSRQFAAEYVSAPICERASQPRGVGPLVREGTCHGGTCPGGTCTGALVQTPWWVSRQTPPGQSLPRTGAPGQVPPRTSYLPDKRSPTFVRGGAFV